MDALSQIQSNVLENSFVFDANSREKFLDIYNKTNKFEGLAKLNDFIKRKSRTGVFLLCSTILALASPIYEDPHTNDQQSFLEKVDEKIRKTALSLPFKAFLKSILLCQDAELVPTFSELKSEYLKLGSDSLTTDDFKNKSNSRAHSKSSDFSRITEFLKILINVGFLKLDFIYDKEFFENKSLQTELLKNSILNIQIIDLDRNEFGSNWNSLANSLSANLINAYGTQPPGFNSQPTSKQKENEDPYMIDASANNLQDISHLKNNISFNKADRYSFAQQAVDNKSKFMNYKQNEDSHASQNFTSQPNAHGGFQKPDTQEKFVGVKETFGSNGASNKDQSKCSINQNLLNTTSLTEKLKKFCYGDTISGSDKNGKPGSPILDPLTRQQTVSLQNIINELSSANGANGNRPIENMASPLLETQINTLINLLQSNQIPPNILQIICDEIFFKNQTDGNLSFKARAQSNKTFNNFENDDPSKADNGSKLEVIELKPFEEDPALSTRRLTFRSDNQPNHQTASPVLEADNDETPMKLGRIISSTNSTSKMFDNGKFMSFAPNKADANPNNKKELVSESVKRLVSNSLSRTKKELSDENIENGEGTPKRSLSYLKKNLTIETEDMDAGDSRMNTKDNAKVANLASQFEKEIRAHVQISPKISVQKTVSVNDFASYNTKSRLTPALSLDQNITQSIDTNCLEVNNDKQSFDKTLGPLPNQTPPIKNSHELGTMLEAFKMKKTHVNEHISVLKESLKQNNFAVGNVAQALSDASSPYTKDLKTYQNKTKPLGLKDTLNTNDGPIQTNNVEQVTLEPSPQPLEFIYDNNTETSKINVMNVPRSPVNRRIVIDSTNPDGCPPFISSNTSHISQDFYTRLAQHRDNSPLKITKVIRRSYTITPDQRIIEHELPKDNVLEELIYNQNEPHTAAQGNYSSPIKSQVNQYASKISKFSPKLESNLDYALGRTINNGYADYMANAKNENYAPSNFGPINGTTFNVVNHISEVQNVRPVLASPRRPMQLRSPRHESHVLNPLSPRKGMSPNFNSRLLSNFSQTIHAPAHPYTPFEYNEPSKFSQFAPKIAQNQNDANNSSSFKAQRSDLERFYNGERINPVYPKTSQLHSPRNSDYYKGLLSTFENFTSNQALSRPLNHKGFSSTVNYSSLKNHHPTQLAATSSTKVSYLQAPPFSPTFNDPNSTHTAFRYTPSTNQQRSTSSVRVSQTYGRKSHYSPAPEASDNNIYFPTNIEGVFTTDPNSPILSRGRPSYFGSLKSTLNKDTRLIN